MHLVTQIFVALAAVLGVSVCVAAAWRSWGGWRRPTPTMPVAAAAPAPRPPPLPGALVCPACRREYGPGLKFCPGDGRALVSLRPLEPTVAATVFCPRCRRSYESVVKGVQTRFCPIDAEEVIAVSAVSLAGAGKPLGATGSGGKICPICGVRYEHDVTHCRRDGVALVPLN